MKPLIILLLIGNVALGQDSVISGILPVGSANDNMTETPAQIIGKGVTITGKWQNENKTYGYITFIDDTTNNIGFVLEINGYYIESRNQYPLLNKYFDLKGRELFKTRFKKGKFLNFYAK